VELVEYAAGAVELGGEKEAREGEAVGGLLVGFWGFSFVSMISYHFAAKVNHLLFICLAASDRKRSKKYSRICLKGGTGSLEYNSHRTAENLSLP
jgi:hypothetical protein